MANYKANWLRKKLIADGQLIAIRARDLCGLISNKGPTTRADVNQAEVDLDAFVDTVKDWRDAVLKELQDRVETVEE